MAGHTQAKQGVCRLRGRPALLRLLAAALAVAVLTPAFASQSGGCSRRHIRNETAQDLLPNLSNPHHH
jgi:hypothetical protein